jgi:crotonobetainyl-CoA:carnitine CoA-transferase CaiB-like acyl-CoA transferase
MAGPLTGVKVVDVCAMMAGPLATTILAEQGADVIKIEPLEGDRLRGANNYGNHEMSAMAFNTNRGKRSIALNLKDPRGLELAKRIIKQADVFVENFRTGVANRLGLGYDVLSASDPRLIYVRASGVGSIGPEAGRRVYDPVIQAMVGLCHLQRDANGPQFVNTIVADKVAPALLAQAITAALYERTVSGVGQFVEQSMLHAMLWWLWPDTMGTHTFTVDDHLEEPPAYSGPQMIYATADGHVMVQGGANDEWHGLCKAVNRLDLIEDERFTDYEDRDRNKEAFAEIFTKEFAKATNAEWAPRLKAGDAVYSMINSARDVLKEEQVLANNMFEVIQTEAFGELRLPTPCAQFSRTPSSGGLGPRLGEHTDSILTELGLSADDQESLRSNGVIR